MLMLPFGVLLFLAGLIGGFYAFQAPISSGATINFGLVADRILMLEAAGFALVAGAALAAGGAVQNMLDERIPRPSARPEAPMRLPCPTCAEAILPAATVCPFCRSEIPPELMQATIARVEQQKAKLIADRKKANWRTALLMTGLIVVIIAAAIAAGAFSGR